MPIPDNYDLWKSYEAQQEAKLARCPVCDNPRCRKRIQDDFYFYIGGEILCQDCMEDRYMYRTEEYME